MLRPSKLKSLGEFCQWYRSKYDLNGLQLAEATGVTKQYYYMVERDDFLFPQNYIKALSKVLTKEEKEILVGALSRSIRELIEA